jgi:hypothetical protein
MSFPKWLKVAWWILLTSLLTMFLCQRYPDLVRGRAAPADIVVFVTWVALLLAPIFTEVSLLGFTFKQQIEELGKNIEARLTEIKSEVNSAINVGATISPQIVFQSIASDTQLLKRKEEIKIEVDDEIRRRGIIATPKQEPLSIPEDVSYLFAARLEIEKELRRIVGGQQILQGIEGLKRQPASVIQIVRHLTQTGKIDSNFAQSILDVYAVCSPAIHGEPVSPGQVDFVKDIAPRLLTALRATSLLF